jgi:crooked neck
VILNQRRLELETDLKVEPFNYDLWFDYSCLEEQSSLADPSRINAIYQRAVENTPPTTQNKALWKRYIYLYLNWAANAELNQEDTVVSIYQEILKKIPHAQFTFTKVWIQFS